MFNGYNGNASLKKAGTKQEFTPEQIVEYIKCRDDILYFIRTYCKIVTLDDGLQLFQPYDYQEKMVDAFATHRFVINLLPRQMGKTTIVAAYLLHYAIFHSDKTIGILANKAPTAREILDRIQKMYEFLPLWLQPGVKEWAKGHMVLGNGSRILAAATSSDSIRGFAMNLIYLDEFAHVEGADEFWESTYPVISSGKKSQVIITSTPKGLNLFHKIYNDAVEGKNEFHAISVHWSEHPERDEDWKRTQLVNMSPKKFAQEFDCEFLGSSNTLIDGPYLESLTAKSAIRETPSIKVFEDVKEGHTYVIVVDTSRGKGLDYHAASIMDVTTMPYKQVATIRDNLMTPYEYAEALHRAVVTYNNAFLLVEINDLGQQVADLLYFDFECENLFFTETAGRAGKRITGGFGAKNVDRGIRTTKTVKATGCNLLKLLIEQQQLIVRDENAIHELKHFERSGTSYNAASGHHDDLVIGMVLFAWLTAQPFFRDLTDNNTLQQLREKTEEQMEQEMLPLGFRVDGLEQTTTWA